MHIHVNPSVLDPVVVLAGHQSGRRSCGGNPCRSPNPGWLLDRGLGLPEVGTVHAVVGHRSGGPPEQRLLNSRAAGSYCPAPQRVLPRRAKGQARRGRCAWHRECAGRPLTDRPASGRARHGCESGLCGHTTLHNDERQRLLMSTIPAGSEQVPRLRIRVSRSASEGWALLGSRESYCRWDHAWRTRFPQMVVGFTRMKCAGTPSIHGSSPTPVNGARSASVSR